MKAQLAAARSIWNSLIAKVWRSKKVPIEIKAMRLVARIPEERIDSVIQWLVLEDDPEDTNDVFLFFHSSLDEPSEFDSWHETQDLALAEASRLYGITKANWQATPKM